MRYMITEEMMNSYQKHLVRGEYAQDIIKKYLRDVGAFMTWLDGFTAGRTEEAASDVNTGLSISLGSGVTAQASCHAADAEEAAPESEVGEGGSWARSAMVDKEGTTGWKAHLTEKGYAPATVNAMLSSLNSFLGYLGWDDCKVKFLKIQRRTFRDQEKELNRAEYGRLLEAAKESGNTRLALLLETVCATGIRVSEVRYVTVEILRQRRADISLKGKVRTILLPGKLCRKLMDYARKKGIASGEVFVTRSGRGMSRRQIWQEMKGLCKRAGVNPSKVFPHNLRHLFARTFYKASRDIVKLADVLGHSSIETTRIYLISTGETHARQMERLGLIS